MKQTYGLGALDFYVVSLLVAEPGQEILNSMGIELAEVPAQLQALAVAGGGIYVAPMAEELDLTKFDFSSSGCLDD